jgi:hypothetical protein
MRVVALFAVALFAGCGWMAYEALQPSSGCP